MRQGFRRQSTCSLTWTRLLKKELKRLELLLLLIEKSLKQSLFNKSTVSAQKIAPSTKFLPFFDGVVRENSGRY
jgi:hypothetical protein